MSHSGTIYCGYLNGKKKQQLCVCLPLAVHLQSRTTALTLACGRDVQWVIFPPVTIAICDLKKKTTNKQTKKHYLVVFIRVLSRWAQRHPHCCCSAPTVEQVKHTLSKYKTHLHYSHKKSNKIRTIPVALETSLLLRTDVTFTFSSLA